MIKFYQDTTLHVIEAFDETTDTVTADCDETFKAGEYVCADIVSENAGYCDLQYGDGSMSYNVPRDSFEVL